MSKQEVILCESLETSLGRAIELCPHDKLFVLTDSIPSVFVSPL